MRLPPKRRALAVIVPVANVRRFFGNHHRSPARSRSSPRRLFSQPPPTAAVAPSSRAPPAPLSRLRADFCSFCWTFSVVLVSYRKNTEVSSREPSRRRRSRATLEVPFSRGDWETWGGSPEATSPSPGTGARRRDVSGVAPLARPCPRRLGGLESPDGVSGGGGSANRSEDCPVRADCVDERRCGTASRERRTETYPRRRRRRALPPSSA